MTQELGDPKKRGRSDDPTGRVQDQTRDRLSKFLDEMHAQMPDVPEEDVQEAIEEAIAAVRDRPIE